MKKYHRVSSKKIKTELLFDPAYSLLGMFPKQSKLGYEEVVVLYVHCSIIHNYQDMDITEQWSVTLKKRKLCLVRQSGWTWRAL